jgi:hypothetical protein
MSGERNWVRAITNEVAGTLGRNITVLTDYRLPYAFQVGRYRINSGLQAKNPTQAAVPEPVTITRGYQTDLLIGEQVDKNDWIPHVVVEFKLGHVTTHDALTYSAKAATHKNVHPYLRYGIIIGGFEGEVPGRLIRHGDHFDFMATLPSSKKLSKQDRERLTELLKAEISASKKIGRLISGKSGVWLLHRKLEIRSYTL